MVAVGGCDCSLLVAIRLYVLCVKSCRLLNCLFSLLLVHLFYFAWEFFNSKQMNLLINDVTFRSAVIRQITAAGPPFCDLRSFICLHSRWLFMVCFWTIIGCGCFSAFYCHCTFLPILCTQDLSHFCFLALVKFFVVLWYLLVTIQTVEEHNFALMNN